MPDYNLVIEFHGDQHLIGWGRNDLDAQGIQARDLYKKTWAIEHGINYLEIKQWEIKSKEEIFYSLKEAQIIVGEWVKHYNHVRSHSALGYRPPAPQVQIPKIIQNQPMLLQ